MTLENYIISSVFAWPSLYYRNNWENTRRAVLNQLFLVIGNGIEFNTQKGTFCNSHYKRKKLLKKDAQKIINGEKLVVVYNKIDEEKIKLVFPDRDSKEKIMFFDDFLKLNKKYLIWGQKKPEGKLNFDCIIKTYPYDLEKQYCWHPYPYNLNHTAFCKNGNFLDANLIQPDWRKGIVEIYTEAKNWFESDLWRKDKYYNWAETIREDDFFIKNWNKQPDKLKLCSDYGIIPFNYENPLDFARECVKSRIKQHIQDAQKVIDFYS